MPQQSKREARIERKNKKALDGRAKCARLKSRIASQFPKKSPRSSEDPNSIYSLLVCWNCNAADTQDSWTWGVARQWTDEAWSVQISPKLDEFSKLTWGEVDSFSSETGHKMHHSMQVEQICEEAQYRLIELDQYHDTIFRFRLGGKQRLWGFRILSEFSVLWFDPTHEIYPVD